MATQIPEHTTPHPTSDTLYLSLKHTLPPASLLALSSIWNLLFYTFFKIHSGLGSNVTSPERSLFLTSPLLFLLPALFFFLPLIPSDILLFADCQSPSTRMSAMFIAAIQASRTRLAL